MSSSLGWLFAPILILLLLGPSIQAGPGQTHSLETELRPLIDGHRGSVAVTVRHLETGEAISINGAEVMPTASLIKLPVMVTVYHLAAAGRVNLDEVITLQEADKVPGSGILTNHFSPGTQLSLRDVVHLMIAYSDNTATNLVVDRIGLAATNEYMAKLGLPQTRLNSKVYQRDTSIDVERSEKYGLGSTTADELVGLLQKLQAGELGDQHATGEMIGHLLACEEREKLQRFLPPGTKIAHKSGSVAKVRCEGGILYCPDGPVAVCVLTANNEDTTWRADNSGNRLCADIGLAVFNYFSTSRAGQQESFATTLARGSLGEMVEVLQRTLNARLDPSPGLATDGDFGPATEDAVMKFQKRNMLEATGRVGPETWEKLEPLLTEDPPVAEPDVVNARVLQKEPPDALHGPPFLTCKAWAVADGESGEFLWGHMADEPLDFASTTKIMTGYLVCRLAAHDPGVLGEMVLTSTRADETSGSSAKIRVGEQLPVIELLYGLMLPSGNDAAVALAEHFGERVKAPRSVSLTRESSLPADQRYDAFIAAMNNGARELGMEKTGYCNPHGMTTEGHRTTCRDLLILAHASMQNELFRKIVSTRERGVQVTGASGYHRNLLWTNTNRLLPIEGYLGIKTGTTDAAGACLVSAAERKGKRLLLCVLGASSSDARYVDSRNLFRWAWNKLEE